MPWLWYTIFFKWPSISISWYITENFFTVSMSSAACTVVFGISRLRGSTSLTVCTLTSRQTERLIVISIQTLSHDSCPVCPLIGGCYKISVWICIKLNPAQLSVLMLMTLIEKAHCLCSQLLLVCTSVPEQTSSCSITPQPSTSNQSPWKRTSISKEGCVKGK